MKKKIITDTKKIKLMKPIGSPDDSRELSKVVFWFKEEGTMATWTKAQKEDLDLRFSKVNKRMIRIEDRMTRIEDRVTKIEERLSQIEKTLQLILSKL